MKRKNGKCVKFQVAYKDTTNNPLCQERRNVLVWHRQGGFQSHKHFCGESVASVGIVVKAFLQWKRSLLNP